MFGYKYKNNKTKPLKIKKMTKLFSIIAVAILATTVVSCGPSAEEKAKMEEKKMQDSLRIADSITAALSASLETAVNEAAATSTDVAATTETAATTEAPVKH